MSFLEIVGGFAERDIAGIGNKFLPSMLRTGLSEGLSGNQMLNALRTAGLGIGTQRFYGLLGEVQATQAMHETVAGKSLADELGDSDFAEWTTARASGYLYQIRAYFQSVDALSGQLIRTFKPFDVRSSSIISLTEALGRALDYMDLGGTVGSLASLVGLEVTGLFKMLAGAGR